METKKRNILIRIILGIIKVISAIFKGIYYFFYSIRFIFYIPGLTLAAGVFGFCLVALFDTLVKILLPTSFDTGFIETFTIAVVFVLLQVYIFRRKMDESLTYNWQKALILTFIPVIFCMGLCYFLNLEDLSKESFVNLFSNELYPPESFDEVYMLLLPFYAPHLWLGCLTGEFWISSMVCMFINVSVAWGICLGIGLSRENFAKNKELERLEEESLKEEENGIY